MTDITSESKEKRPRSALSIVIAVLIIVGAIMLFQFLKINESLRAALEWIHDLGFAGKAIYAALYISATVLFVPGSIITLGAGFLYGVLWGSALVSFSSTIGASLAFLIGRYIARGWVQRKIESNPRFRSLDDSVGKEGWKIVLLCRLSPAFPFNMLNYALGLTRVRFWHYLVASWIGMLPGTILYVYIGSLASDISTLGSAGRSRTPWEWGFYAVGFVATAAVTIFVTRLARRSLRAAIGDEKS